MLEIEHREHTFVYIIFIVVTDDNPLSKQTKENENADYKEEMLIIYHHYSKDSINTNFVLIVFDYSHR